MRSRDLKDMRKKVCKLCIDRVAFVSYRDEKRLQRAITDRGKIVPRRISGNCARHQRAVTVAVKRSRQLALMPFASVGL